MSGHDLLEALKATGTGKAKIEAGEAELELRPTLTGAELCNTMKLQNLWPEGTLEKAARLLGGSRVADFLGTPPPNASEAKLLRMAEVLSAKQMEAFEERMARTQSENLANPAALKPLAAEKKK